MFQKVSSQKPFKDRFPKTVKLLKGASVTWLRCSEVIDNDLCSALCKIAMFSHVCFVCGECSCVCVIPGDWLCACACMRQLCWSLPPISLTPAHPCTWVFFYVHCGFSTCPALRSRPQIRAVYLTAVASSISYKNTPVPSLPPSSCISCFLSSLSINAAANVLHRAVSCRLALLLFFFFFSVRWKKMKNCAHKQPRSLEETNTCRERERDACQECSYTTPRCCQTWENSTMQKEASTIRHSASRWLTAFPSHVISRINI